MNVLTVLTILIFIYNNRSLEINSYSFLTTFFKVLSHHKQVLRWNNTWRWKYPNHEQNTIAFNLIQYFTLFICCRLSVFLRKGLCSILLCEFFMDSSIWYLLSCNILGTNQWLIIYWIPSDIKISLSTNSHVTKFVFILQFGKTTAVSLQFCLD